MSRLPAVVLPLLFALGSSLPLPHPPASSSPADELVAIAANDNRRPAGRLEQGVLTLTLEVREELLRPEGDDGPGVPALAFAEGPDRNQLGGMLPCHICMRATPSPAPRVPGS